MKTAFNKLFSQKRMILFSKKKQMKNESGNGEINGKSKKEQ
jgi:hypothetical protein